MSGGGADLYTPPLQVLGVIGTRRSDPDRGPQVRLNAQDAALRLLVDGELVRVAGPRRSEIAVLLVDDTIPRGGAVVRDVAGLVASELVRVSKLDLDRPRRHLA